MFSQSEKERKSSPASEMKNDRKIPQFHNNPARLPCQWKVVPLSVGYFHDEDTNDCI